MAAPANDNFADATLLTGASGSIRVVFTESTIEATEPSPDPAYEFNTDYGAPSVWYKWVAPTSGRHIFWVNNYIDSYNTKKIAAIDVWTGTALNNLVRKVYILQAYDDNSFIFWNAIQDQEYYISVYTWDCDANLVANPGWIDLYWRKADVITLDVNFTGTDDTETPTLLGTFEAPTLRDGSAYHWEFDVQNTGTDPTYYWSGVGTNIPFIWTLCAPGYRDDYLNSYAAGKSIKTDFVFGWAHYVFGWYTGASNLGHLISTAEYYNKYPIYFGDTDFETIQDYSYSIGNRGSGPSPPQLPEEVAKQFHYANTVLQVWQWVDSGWGSNGTNTIEISNFKFTEICPKFLTVGAQSILWFYKDGQWRQSGTDTEYDLHYHKEGSWHRASAGLHGYLDGTWQQ